MASGATSIVSETDGSRDFSQPGQGPITSAVSTGAMSLDSGTSGSVTGPAASIGSP